MTSVGGDREAELRNWLVDYFVTNIGCNPDQIYLDAPVNELGLGSRDAVVLSGELSEWLDDRSPRWTSGRTRPSTAWPMRWSIPRPKSGRLNVVRRHRRFAERADRRSSGSAAGCPVTFTDPTRCGTSWPPAAPRSAPFPTTVGQAFDDGPPERLRPWRVPRGGARSSSDVAGFDAEFFEHLPARSRPHRSAAAPAARSRCRGAGTCRDPGRIAAALADRGVRRGERQRVRVPGGRATSGRSTRGRVPAVR